MKKLWKKFDALTEKCYMSGLDEACTAWDEAYQVFLDIVSNGRGDDPNFAAEIVDLDECTDFQYGVMDWVEDYLDELDVREEHEKLIKICKKLMKMFRWEKYDCSDLKFRIASSLAVEGKKQEALEFAEEWYRKETNIMSATALVYARMSMRDLEGSQQIIDNHISKDTPCTEDNDILFMAAADLYSVNGKEEERQAVTEALHQYEQGIDGYEDDMDDDISFELPFE